MSTEDLDNIRGQNGSCWRTDGWIPTRLLITRLYRSYPSVRAVVSAVTSYWDLVCRMYADSSSMDVGCSIPALYQYSYTESKEIQSRGTGTPVIVGAALGFYDSIRYVPHGVYLIDSGLGCGLIGAGLGARIRIWIRCGTVSSQIKRVQEPT